MHRAHAGLGADRRAGRLAELEAERPEWRGWLRLLGAALEALDDSAWTEIAVERPAVRPAGAPLLDGAAIAVDARAATRWVRRLFAAAAEAREDGPAAIPDPNSVDALALLEAAVRQDTAGVARAAGTAPHAAAPLAQLAALPLLHACRSRLADEVETSWVRGYCPVCGGWPTLAELRGLERTRRLRCGRCGGDWSRPVLECAFCDETDHWKQPMLSSAGEEETRRIDCCRSCSGYVKTMTVLQPTPGWALALQDVSTVELDLAALERGYTRPDHPAYLLECRVVEARRAFALPWRRS